MATTATTRAKSPRGKNKVKSRVVLRNSVKSGPLTKAGTANAVILDIFKGTGPQLLGTLEISRGSVQWTPSGTSGSVYHDLWGHFCEDVLTAHMTELV
jgi:hypothetical protein